jgi:hypothetical protein
MNELIANGWKRKEAILPEINKERGYSSLV